MENKNAIIVLTRGYEKLTDYKMLIERNKNLLKYRNEKIDYIIFHEGDITMEHQKYINSFTPELKLIYVNVQDEFKKDDIPLKIDMYWSLGYRNMCNFWFVSFWKYVQQYDKIIRIDEDCNFYSNYNNIFKKLDNKISIFGAKSYDELFVIEGINNFTINFLKDKNINVKKRKVWGPYTNVIGLNLVKLRNNKLLFNFINRVKDSNNIYFYRWGDLPLWGEVLYYFYNESDYIIDKNINYYHASHNREINKQNYKNKKLLTFILSKQR